MKSLVYTQFNHLVMRQQLLDALFGDTPVGSHDAPIYQLGRAVEHIAERAYIHAAFLLLQRFFQPQHNLIIESQRTSHIAVDGCGREVLEAVEDSHDFRIFMHRLLPAWQQRLSRLQCLASDRQSALYHQLQHETAHFAAPTVFRSYII